MHDPLTDPRPGDVVAMANKWNRHVLNRDGDRVVYYSLFHGIYLGPFEDSVSDWSNAVATAKVLHVAEAEAREAVTPTAADLAVADELDLLAEHIREYIGIDDARDEIRRICLNSAVDLRKGVSRSPTAAEVIAAAKEALEGVAFARHVKSCRDAMKLIAAWEAAQR